MDAYAFTRFEADRVHLLKARQFDLDVVAFAIGRNNPTDNYFRDTEEYKMAKDTYIELTMSCDREEAIWWMKRWMLNAIAYGSSTKELDWRAYYMAAYDMYKSLTK